jgi:hypothetical protein
MEQTVAQLATLVKQIFCYSHADGAHLTVGDRIGALSARLAHGQLAKMHSADC